MSGVVMLFDVKPPNGRVREYTVDVQQTATDYKIRCPVDDCIKIIKIPADKLMENWKTAREAMFLHLQTGHAMVRYPK